MQQQSAVSESGLVITVSMRASDLAKRHQTEKHLLSTASGQGNLPAWIESELLGAPVGSRYLWKISPKDRPASIANDPQLPRNSLIWLELELLESHEANTEQTTQLLSDPAKMRQFAHIVYDVFVSQQNKSV